MSCKLYGVEPIYEGEDPCPPAQDGIISNAYFEISAEPDGALTVKDLETRRVLKGINRLADGGDCGDEYTYCPPDEDGIVHADSQSISVRILARDAVRSVMEVSGVLKLPADVVNRTVRRSDARVDCPFTSTITLYAGVRRIDIRTTVDNRAKHHRLRALFPVGCLAETSRSAGAFSVDERPVTPEADPEAKEDCRTHPQKDFCDAGNREFGVTVANRGLHEYEAYDEAGETVLAVTLLRCTEVISQRRMKTRKFKGGWSEKAPGAQCPGIWTFEYSVIPHARTWVESQSYVQAHAYNFPMTGFQMPSGQAGGLCKPASLVQVNCPAMIISALKQCEFEDAYILRMYNSTPQPVAAQLTFSDAVHRVLYANLREDTLYSAGMKQGCVQIDARPFEIITLKLEI